MGERTTTAISAASSMATSLWPPKPQNPNYHTVHDLIMKSIFETLVLIGVVSLSKLLVSYRFFGDVLEGESLPVAPLVGDRFALMGEVSRSSRPMRVRCTA